MVSICRTKKAEFSTRGAAEEAMEKVRIRNGNRALSGLDVPNAVYECPYCQQWHMTHRGTKGWSPKQRGQKNRGKPGKVWDHTQG